MFFHDTADEKRKNAYDQTRVSDMACRSRFTLTLKKTLRELLKKFDLN